jgi:hypothetical protein
MTIREAISRVNTLRPNRFSELDMIGWLSKLDGVVSEEILGGAPFAGYHADTPADTQLIIRAPYEDTYVHYLLSEIDYHNAEYQRYNNSASLFNASYASFADWHTRSNLRADNTHIRI